ncbi:MAG TPA: hypothetical protein V6D19_05370 [Stenomitos sp.]
MTTIAEFRFPLPPCLNEQINIARNNRYGSAKEKEKWTNDIAALAKKQNQSSYPGKVWMQFIYYLKNSRRDPDNVSASRKYILDGLVQAGIIVNDNLQIIQSPIIESFVVSEPGRNNAKRKTKSQLNSVAPNETDEPLRDKIKILTDEVVVKICDECIYLVG